MPLTDKGKKIMGAMEVKYGKKKAKNVFYASRNKGVIKGVEHASRGKLIWDVGKHFPQIYKHIKPHKKSRGGMMNYYEDIL